MNSQIFPRLSESFIRQEHARLMEEAERRRLLRQIRASEPVRHYRFSINWMQKTHKNASITKASVLELLTGSPEKKGV